MKKKRIAMFATGWASEILYKYMCGVKKGLSGYPADMYLFLSYVTYSDSDAHFQGEVNIFQLPHLEDFDGALVFANGIDFPQIIGEINTRCKQAGIPVVYTGNDKLDGFYVGSDNYVGARALCDHLIEEHGAREFIFIAGSRDNMDSNTRMKALQDALKAHGGELKEENICYSNWDINPGGIFVKKRISEGYVPDAVVCANDILAMMLCQELEDFGYPVPDKIRVTGFDNDTYAQIFDPALSSVDQRFDLIGERAAKTLISAFQREKVDSYQTIPCEFVPSESCGCMSAKDFGKIRKSLGKNKFIEDKRSTFFDQNLLSMERQILSGKSYRDLTENFFWIHKGGLGSYQGYSFHVVLEPLFEQSIFNQERQLRRKGYAPVMDAIFSIEGKNLVSNPKFDSRELVPQIMQDPENHLYIFLSVHEGDANMGYLVFTDDLEKIREDLYLRKYKDRVNIVLGSYLRGLRADVLHHRLLDMTETDALTHVKNRTAYEARAEKIQERMKKEAGLEYAVAVFDVNNLKRINDNLGHEAGDEYIIDACMMICKIFKKSPVYRIGGDEFAVVLENEDYDSREELMQEVKNAIEKFQASDLPEQKRVSVAAGMAVYDRNTDTEYIQVFNRADARMYANKTKMKQEKQ